MTDIVPDKECLEVASSVEKRRMEVALAVLTTVNIHHSGTCSKALGAKALVVSTYQSSIFCGSSPGNKKKWFSKSLPNR